MNVYMFHAPCLMHSWTIPWVVEVIGADRTISPWPGSTPRVRADEKARKNDLAHTVSVSRVFFRST